MKTTGKQRLRPLVCSNRNQIYQNRTPGLQKYFALDLYKPKLSCQELKMFRIKQLRQPGIRRNIPVNKRPMISNKSVPKLDVPISLNSVSRIVSTPKLVSIHRNKSLDNLSMMNRSSSSKRQLKVKLPVALENDPVNTVGVQVSSPQILAIQVKFLKTRNSLKLV